MSTTVSKKPETSIKDLPTNPFVFEVLDLVSKQRSNSKKLKFLKNMKTFRLKLF